MKCLKALADAKENWRDNLIAKAKRGFSSQGMKNRKNSTLECFENNFQLISHVKDHKLLDKEFQVLKGKQPIRGNFDLKLTSNNLLNPKQTYLNSTERSRPFTARETQKDAITDKNHNKSFENDNVCEELDLNLWNNSPKNRDKKQKELDRKLNYGKHKKKDNAGYSDLFMTNINKHQNDRAFQEKVEKIKIFKRLRIDKMFPLRQFSFH